MLSSWLLIDDDNILILRIVQNLLLLLVQLIELLLTDYDTLLWLLPLNQWLIYVLTGHDMLLWLTLNNLHLLLSTGRLRRMNELDLLLLLIRTNNQSGLLLRL